MKKRRILSIVLGIIFILILILIYFVHGSKKLNSEVNSFSIKISDKAKFIGVTDDKVYYLEDNILYSKDNEKEIFSKVVGIDIVDIIYGRYIYVFEKSGNISMYSRHTGELLKSKKLEKIILKAKNYENDIIVFCQNGINIITPNLENVRNFDNLKSPVNFSSVGDSYSYIEMEESKGILYSKYSVFDSGEEIFSINTSNELFVYSSMINKNESILISNKYIYKIVDGKISEKTIVFNLKSVDNFNGRYAIADGRNLKIYDKSFKLESETNLDFDVIKLSVRNNTIAIIGESQVAVYENGNIIKTNISYPKNYYISSQGVYVIFDNKIDRIKAN